MRANTPESLWNHVLKTETCWLWTGRCGPYGRITVRRQAWLPHRLAYTLVYGPIPDGMCVCHHCDRPGCVRPDHLFLGTKADNSHDRDAKGRQIAPRGHRNGNATHPERRPRGEAHGCAKLTATSVLAIRARIASGQATRRGIAAEYGMSRDTIEKIVNRKLWRHI